VCVIFISSRKLSLEKAFKNQVTRKVIYNTFNMTYYFYPVQVLYWRNNTLGMAHSTNSIAYNFHKNERAVKIFFQSEYQILRGM